MVSAAAKGKSYEELIVDILNQSGLEAWRTNKANIADPVQYKAGFDGGVDICATFSHNGKSAYKEFLFYIQCKNHKVPLEKTAVAEVYAGMHVRNATADNCIPVVFSTSDASEETRLYAKQLGVELILPHEMSMIIQAKKTGKVPYDNYGILMRTILFYHTHDEVWFDTLPDNKNNLAMVSMADQYMDSAKSEFDKAEFYLNNAAALEQRALENRKKHWISRRLQFTGVFVPVKISDLTGTDKRRTLRRMDSWKNEAYPAEISGRYHGL